MRMPSRPWVAGLIHGRSGSERSVHRTDASSSPGASSATYQPRVSPGQPSHSRSARLRARSSQVSPPSRVAITAVWPSAPSRSDPRRNVNRTDPSARARAEVADTVRSLTGAVSESQATPDATTCIWTSVYEDCRQSTMMPARPHDAAATRRRRTAGRPRADHQPRLARDPHRPVPGRAGHAGPAPGPGALRTQRRAPGVDHPGRGQGLAATLEGPQVAVDRPAPDRGRGGRRDLRQDLGGRGHGRWRRRQRPRGQRAGDPPEGRPRGAPPVARRGPHLRRRPAPRPGRIGGRGRGRRRDPDARRHQHRHGPHRRDARARRRSSWRARSTAPTGSGSPACSATRATS